MNNLFYELTRRNGGYSLPYLIHLYDEKEEEKRKFEIFFVNSQNDIQFEEKIYKSGTFAYKSNNAENGFDGGGKLEIAVKDNQIINLIESRDSIYLDVIGILNEKNNVQKIKTFKHHYCKISGDKTKVSITFEKDDRQTMTFPSLIFSPINNRGNS